MGKWEMKGKPALVIIHMQHAVVSEDGKLGSFRGLAEIVKKQGIITHQQDLLAGFRNKNLPIIYIVAVVPNNASFSGYGDFWNAMSSMSNNLNVAGSKDVEVIPELAPQQGEPVLGNWPIGAFSNTNLQQLLKEYRVETVILAGVATEHAVLATVLQAVELGYAAIVPNDASISGEKIAHKLVMSNIFPHISLVTTTQDVIVHL